jgi:DNA-binding CsgD family transcriptional regulator
LARFGIGVFVLDSLRRVVFTNPAANVLLGDGLDLVDGQLRAIAPASDRMDAAIGQAIADTGDPAARPVPIVIRRARPRRPLAVHVMPIHTFDDPAEHFPERARALILIIDADAGSPPSAALVRELFGLTDGEARVAALIGSGLRPQEAAAELGVAVETARTVLKRVFQKVGVSRQSELTALMARLMLR